MQTWQELADTNFDEDVRRFDVPWEVKEGFSDVWSFPSSDHSGQRGSGADCMCESNKEVFFVRTIF